MWSGGVSYDVGGKGFDPTVGKITETSGEVFVEWLVDGLAAFRRFDPFCC